jgi:hypothetical protein
MCVFSSTVAFNTGPNIGTSPVAMPSPTNSDGQQSAPTSDAAQDASSEVVGGNVHNRPNDA